MTPQHRYLSLRGVSSISQPPPQDVKFDIMDKTCSEGNRKHIINHNYLN